MARLFVVVFSVLGAAFVLPRCSVSVYNTAFTLAGMSFTWLFVLCIGVAFAAYKVTK